MSDPSTPERRHPNYVVLWAILVAALGISMLMGEMQLPVITVVLIFSIAIIKAWLVASYYMHLSFEPVFVVAMIVAGLICLYILFIGLVPDIVYPPLVEGGT